MNTIYRIEREYTKGYVAYILTPESETPEEMTGYKTKDVFHAAIITYYDLNAMEVPKSVFQREVDRRKRHTEEMLILLCLGGASSTSHVYGSATRPANSSWARLENAIYIHVDKETTGYYTYIAVPSPLSKDIQNNYELDLISHPREEEKHEALSNFPS